MLGTAVLDGIKFDLFIPRMKMDYDSEISRGIFVATIMNISTGAGIGNAMSNDPILGASYGAVYSFIAIIGNDIVRPLLKKIF